MLIGMHKCHGNVVFCRYAHEPGHLALDLGNYASFIYQIGEGIGDFWGPSVSLYFGVFFMCPVLNCVKIHLGAGAGVIMVGAD